MVSQDFEDVILEAAPQNGRKGRQIILRKGDRVFYERIDVGSFEACQKMLRKAAKFLGFEVTGFFESLYPRLIEEAKQADTKADNEARPLAGQPAEIDVENTIRVERFITPDVSGLTVPVAVPIDSQIIKTWRVYIRWTHGGRESRDCFPTLDLSNGRRLWVHPIPGAPPEDMSPGWSRFSRDRWLAGEEAIDPSTVFQGVCRYIADYLDFPKDQAPGHTATLALFIVLTYSAAVFQAVPYLFFWGTAGSGKTRALEVLRELTFRPYLSASPSPALVYRTLHIFGGTLLLDEAEKLKNATRDPAIQELLAVLQAGYRRGGAANRLEQVGETFNPVSFQVFGPKALASIGGPPPVLATRCITIPMLRAGEESPKPKRRIVSDKAQPLRDALHVLALDHGSEFLELPERDVCPKGIFGRNWELWQPILSLASWFEDYGAEGLLHLLQEHALRLVEQSQEETVPPSDEVLLRILSEKLNETPTPGQILDSAKVREPDLFRGWTARKVSEHLKRYGLRTIKSNGIKIYPRSLAGELQRIENTHGIELANEKSNNPTP